VTAIIHLHRAEVARLTTYRVRLDTTTSWAVTSSALVTTFALANPQIPHVAFLFLGFIVFYFLSLEARRFRAYEASRHRVHLIERSFYREVLGGHVDPKWTDQLLEAIEQPGITVNRLGALGWRLRRNYLWILTAVLVTWLGKLYLTGESPNSSLDLVARAAIGGIPGWLVMAIVVVCYLALLLIAMFARRIYPLGDDEARQMMEQVSEE
jgi:uncharacterized membrane protein